MVSDGSGSAAGRCAGRGFGLGFGVAFAFGSVNVGKGASSPDVCAHELTANKQHAIDIPTYLSIVVHGSMRLFMCAPKPCLFLAPRQWVVTVLLATACVGTTAPRSPSTPVPVVAADACRANLAGCWQIDGSARLIEMSDDGRLLTMRYKKLALAGQNPRQLRFERSRDGGLGIIAFVPLPNSAQPYPEELTFERSAQGIYAAVPDAGVVEFTQCSADSFRVTGTANASSKRSLLLVRCLQPALSAADASR